MFPLTLLHVEWSTNRLLGLWNVRLNDQRRKKEIALHAISVECWWDSSVWSQLSLDWAFRQSAIHVNILTVSSKTILVLTCHKGYHYYHDMSKLVTFRSDHTVAISKDGDHPMINIARQWQCNDSIIWRQDLVTVSEQSEDMTDQPLSLPDRLKPNANDIKHIQRFELLAPPDKMVRLAFFSGHTLHKAKSIRAKNLLQVFSVTNCLDCFCRLRSTLPDSCQKVQWSGRYCCLTFLWQMINL